MDMNAGDESKQRYDQIARRLVEQMSLEERVYLMSGNTSPWKLFWEAVIQRHYNNTPWVAGGNRRLNIPPVAFCDGPRGLVSGSATCFPVSMGRGATFDVVLEERIGEAIGKEIRATGGNFYGGVCINLLRHPAGGRAQETFGEDPHHVGQMGAALTRGVQKHNVMACVKHYAVNNQENARFKVDVACDERTLQEVYLPHFKDCIDAGAASVMGAYNKFRGVHCCHNEHLLRRILKEEWGFDGFVISDFIFGVRDTLEAAEGGLDIEMPSTQHYGKKLVKAVRDGQLSPDIIDEAAQRIVRTILRFMEAEDQLSIYPTSLIASPEHISLALEAAEKSIVLLKNEGGVLPFDKGTVKKVALIGRLAKVENIGDHGSSQVHPPYVVTPLDGLRQLLDASVEIVCVDGKDVEQTKHAVIHADAVIIIVGYSHNDEGEFIAEFLKIGGDRHSLNLHQEEVDLIDAVAPLNLNTAVVLIGGSAIMVEEWKSKVAAILHAFYPGMEGGTAIAKILFGHVNPSGKLPFSVPTDPSHLPEFDRNALHVTYNRFHGYTKLARDGNLPAFAFGYGLSFTKFIQENANFQVVNDQVVATVDVKNTGDRFGEQVIQFYVGFDNSPLDRPTRLLEGFARVSLEPGETKQVRIACPTEKLRWYCMDTSSWELEHMVYQAYIDDSSRMEDLLTGEFSL